MKEKHIWFKAVFSMSLFFAICVIISVIVGAFNTCSSGLDSTADEVATVDEVATIDEIATVDEVVVTQPPTTTVVVTETIAPTEVVVYNEENHYNNYSSYSEYEYDLLARTIYQEAGCCSEYCQWLVGSTVLNLADGRGGIENVVFDYNTFNVAYVLYDCTPSDLSYSVAKRVLSGDRDYNVKAFRTDYYHSFGTPYTCVDNVYFSAY